MLRAARHLLAYHPNASGRDMYDDDRLKGFGDDAQSLVDEHDLDTVLMQADDATWILSSAFMILTMQSGFTMRKYSATCAFVDENKASSHKLLCVRCPSPRSRKGVFAPETHHQHHA